MTQHLPEFSLLAKSNHPTFRGPSMDHDADKQKDKSNNDNAGTDVVACWKWDEEQECLNWHPIAKPLSQHSISLRGVFNNDNTKGNEGTQVKRRKFVTSTKTSWTWNRHPVAIQTEVLSQDGDKDLVSERLWIGGNVLESVDDFTTYEDCVGVGVVVVDIVRGSAKRGVDGKQDSEIRFRILSKTVLHNLWDALVSFLLNPDDKTLALVDCIGGQDFSETHLLQLVPSENGKSSGRLDNAKVLPPEWGLRYRALVEPPPHATCTGWYSDPNNVGSFYIALFGYSDDDVWVVRVTTEGETRNSKRPRLEGNTSGGGDKSYDGGKKSDDDGSCNSENDLTVKVETVMEKTKLEVFDAGLRLLLTRISQHGVESIHKNSSVQECFTDADIFLTDSADPLQLLERRWYPGKFAIHDKFIKLEVGGELETKDNLLEFVFLFTLDAMNLNIQDIKVFEHDEAVTY